MTDMTPLRATLKYCHACWTQQDTKPFFWKQKSFWYPSSEHSLNRAEHRLWDATGWRRYRASALEERCSAHHRALQVPPVLPAAAGSSRSRRGRRGRSWDVAAGHAPVWGRNTPAEGVLAVRAVAARRAAGFGGAGDNRLQPSGEHVWAHGPCFCGPCLDARISFSCFRGPCWYLHWAFSTGQQRVCNFLNMD